MAKSKKEKGKPGKPRAIRRGLVVLAVATLWAAGHQPESFTPSSVVIWALGLFTAGLLARAAFAVAEPMIKLALSLLLHLLQRQRAAAEDER